MISPDGAQQPQEHQAGGGKSYRLLLAKIEEVIEALDEYKTVRAAALLGELRLIIETLDGSAQE